MKTCYVSINGWMDKENIIEYYLSIKREKILSFAKTSMDIDNIMLSEISQTEKDKYCMLSLICQNLKIKQMHIRKHK